MAAPLNKKGLETTVATNLPTQSPGQQLITAAKLRDSLTPIIDSTFTTKTIWSGIINTTSDTTGRKDFSIFENYYDPFYFPPIQSTTSALLNPANKYMVSSAGTGLLVNVNGSNVSTGSFTNIGVTNDSTNTLNVGGTGLTFNGSILNGSLVVSSLVVNNPGTGYASGYGTLIPAGGLGFFDTILSLNLPSGTGPNSVKIIFNMTNTVWPTYINIIQETNFYRNTWSALIPEINNVIGTQRTTTPTVNNIVNFQTAMYTPLHNRSDSANNMDRASACWVNAPNSNTLIYRVGGVSNSGVAPTRATDLPGFNFDIYSEKSTGVGNIKTQNGYLEIKVPVIKQS